MNTWQKLALAALLLVAGRVHAEDIVHYYYTDPQGTVLARTDATGNVIASYDYAPYGNQALGTPPNGPGYTGHVNDPDTGLVYMQARYYDPAVGRFLSVDPVGPSPGNGFNFNRYGYANNNPIVNIDPDGRCTGSLFTDCPGGGFVAGHGYTTFVHLGQSRSEHGGASKTPAVSKPALPTASDSERRPELEKIANSPVVRSAIDKAWKLSNPDVEGARREHGFWVIDGRQKDSFAVKPFPMAGATKDQMAPGAPPTGAVSWFHTHPNPSPYLQGPSPDDKAFGTYWGLPGMIESHSGMYYFGPSLP